MLRAALFVLLICSAYASFLTRLFPPCERIVGDKYHCHYDCSVDIRKVPQHKALAIANDRVAEQSWLCEICAADKLARNTSVHIHIKGVCDRSQLYIPRTRGALTFEGAGANESTIQIIGGGLKTVARHVAFKHITVDVIRGPAFSEMASLLAQTVPEDGWLRFHHTIITEPAHMQIYISGGTSEVLFDNSIFLAGTAVASRPLIENIRDCSRSIVVLIASAAEDEKLVLLEHRCTGGPDYDDIGMPLIYSPESQYIDFYDYAPPEHKGSSQFAGQPYPHLRRHSMSYFCEGTHRSASYW
jgi:hypothetical protein